MHMLFAGSCKYYALCEMTLEPAAKVVLLQTSRATRIFCNRNLKVQQAEV